MEHKSDHTQRLRDKTQQLESSREGTRAVEHASHTPEKTPWSHDAQRYAGLVNVAAGLKLMGWVMFAFTITIGTVFVASGLSAESQFQRTLCLGAGLGFVVVGIIIKVMWHVFSDMVNLMVDISDDLHWIRMK